MEAFIDACLGYAKSHPNHLAALLPTDHDKTLWKARYDQEVSIKRTSASGTNDSRPAPAEQVVVGGIPLHPRGFQVRAPLLAQLGEARLCVITGARGVGKTQLAAAYVQQRISDGWAVVAWIDARTEGLVASAWEEVANKFGIYQDAARAGIACLERLAHPSLVVFDNADDPELLLRWLPRYGRAQIVITTVNRQMEDLGTAVEVGVFTTEEALAFLRARTDLPDDGALAVIAELDRLPLALAHAAAVVRRQKISYATHLARLGAVPIERLLPAYCGDPYPLGTAQAILLSVDALCDADDSGLTWGLLVVLSTMPTASRWVLHAVAERMMRTPPGTDVIDAALGMLADHWVINLGLDGFSVAMHRVTAHVISEQHAGQLGQIFLIGCQGLEALTGQPGWPRSRAEHLVDQIDSLSAFCRGDSVDTDVVERVLALRCWAANYLFQTAEPVRAVAAWTAVIADHRDLLGRNNVDLAPMISYLASAYLRNEQFDEAIEVYTTQLALAELTEQELHGSQRLDPNLARLNLAEALKLAGRLDEAVPLYEETLRRRRAAYGNGHLRTLIAGLHLAKAYHASGREDDAIDLVRSTQHRCQVELGVGHLFTLDVRNTLAFMHCSAGRFSEAIAVLREAIDDWRRVNPKDRVTLLIAARALVRAYARAQRYEDAIALCESLAQGPVADHPEELSLRFDHAELLLVTRRALAAGDAFAALFHDTTVMLGPDHPNTARCGVMVAIARESRVSDTH